MTDLPGLGLILVLVFACCFRGADAAAPTVMVLPINGAISPASADFASHGLARAEKEHAQLLVLQMDTPGGLDTSMRQIIKAILASPVPVAAFVAPGGARAASAGTYILYASHIAAMAPGTNLGAATPVQIGMTGPQDGDGQKKPEDGRSGNSGKEAGKEAGKQPGKADKGNAPADSSSAMTRKQVQDAAAYIRGLAQLRGRNADWGERAVREAVSLSADEALGQKVIDVIARDVPELLVKIDGRKVATAAGERVLATRGAQIVTIEPDWKTRFLAVITEPSVALILMMLGVYGLLFEFSSPGFVLPGVIGAICLLLGLFALHLLPVDYAGLALVMLGLAFLVAEAFIGSFGVLGVAGAVALGIGAVMLIDTDVPGLGVPLELIAGLTVVSAGFAILVSGMVLKARRRPVVSGQEQLLESTGVMLEDADKQGWARIHGEHWLVHTSVPLKRDQRIKVTARNGLVLTVAPLNESE